LTECAVDGEPFATCSSPFTTSELPDGPHSVTVRHTDAAGSVGSSVVNFDVDLGVPVISITAPVEGAFLSDSTPDISFSVIDDLPGDNACSVDDGDYVACDSPFATGPLSDGPHHVSISHGDLAGNVGTAVRSFTIDTEPPVTPVITSPPGPLTINTTAPMIGGDAEANSEIEVFDGAVSLGTTTTDGNGHWNFTLTAAFDDGEHLITAISTDVEGNASASSDARSITVDTLAPAAPAITTPAADFVTNNQTPTLAGTAEADTTIVIYDGLNPIGQAAADENGAWTFTPSSPLNQADHVITAWATDAAGNQGAASAARTITVDTSAPTLAITAPTDGQRVATDSPQISFIGGGDTTCAMDLETPAACSSPFVASGLADGDHVVTIVATDAAGNAATATRSFSVDSAAPDTTLDSAPPIFDASDEATFEFSSSEPNSTFECQLDAAGWNLCLSPEHLPLLADGTYTFEVRAIDAAGNVDPTPSSATWTVDTQAPAPPQISAPADPAATADSSVTLSGTAEPFSSVSISANGAPLGSTTADIFGDWSFAAPAAFDEGDFELAATASDSAGNSSEPSNQVHLTIDTATPETTLTSTPPLIDNDTAPTFAFASSDAGSSFECMLDDGPWAPCSSPQTYAGSAATPHTFAVRATDSVGNTDPSPASYDWTIETSPPVAPVVTSPADEALLRTATPTFAGTAEPGSVVTIFVDDAAVGTATAAESGAWSMTVSAAILDGSHTLSAAQASVPSNPSPRSAETTFQVDTVAPVGSVIQQTTVLDPGESPTFIFESPSDTTLICKVDDGAFASCSSPFTAPTLPAGNHTLVVSFSDPAGNATVISRPFVVLGASVPPVAPPTGSPSTCAETVQAPTSASATIAKLSRKGVAAITVKIDRFASIRLTVSSGRKLLATGLKSISAGRGSVALRVKRIPRGKKLTLRLDVYARSGAFQSASTTFSASKRGKVTGGALRAAFGADCDTAIKSLTVLGTGGASGAVKSGSKFVKVTASSTQYGLTTFTLSQGHRTIGKTVAAVMPGKLLKTRIRLIAGKRIKQGAASLRITTTSAAGVKVSLTKPLKVR
jgi:hypothetical protein